jgi:integrase
VSIVEKPRSPDRDAEIRYLDGSELEALLRSVPAGIFSDTDGALFLTAAYTGLRRGELLALRWSDIDWLAAKIRVRRAYVRGGYTTPKSRRGSRAVPLAVRLAAELELHFKRSIYQADDDLVFPHPRTGHPLDPSKLARRFKAALRAAQVRQVRLHDLRHTFGTRMAAAGVPLRTLQEWLGHQDIQTTMIYSDYQPDDRREAELVERAFGQGPNTGPKLSETQRNSDHRSPLQERE